ncbi:MAG: hypothetical protein H6737_28275 [Alphaproteobacteria bacterium]|nr:hypothetical protein [Alphaproteobacteria bacterium]
MLVGLGCGVGYKPNLGAKQLADTNRPDRLLIGYLEQTSADPAVCDLARTDGVAIPFADGRVVKALHKGLEKGRIPPDRWARCTLLLWREADALLAQDLGDALLASIGTHLGGTSPAGVGEALLDVLVKRRAQDPLDAERLGALAVRARDRRASVDPNAAEHLVLGDLAAVLDAEAGLYEGRPLKKDAIAATSDAVLLTQWALRLPDPVLRRAAGERLLDVRIERSPFAWVRENAATVRDAAMKGPVGLPPGAALIAARWSPARDGTAMLRLHQEPTRGKVRLLPAGADGTRSADPSLDLVDTLWVDVDGLERPITVCGDAPFDPTPCVPPKQLQMRHPVAELAPTGRLLFPRELDAREFIELGRDGDRLSAQVVVEGLIAQVDLPIQFDSVPELFLQAPGNRGNGPEAKVEVWELSHGRLLFEVRSVVLGRKPWTALVESTDAAFSIQSYGSMTSAQEGRGGDITVTMHCTDCPAVRETVKRMVRSTGQAPGKVTIRKGK